jgi:hypothetical protein
MFSTIREQIFVKFLSTANTSKELVETLPCRILPVGEMEIYTLFVLRECGNLDPMVIKVTQISSSDPISLQDQQVMRKTKRNQSFLGG